MIVGRLAPVDKVSLKYTSSYFHSWIRISCNTFQGLRRSVHMNRLSRDIGSLPAVVICPCCFFIHLRSLVHDSPSLSWALKPPKWHEQVRPCCEASLNRLHVPRTLGKSAKVGMEEVSIRIIDVQKPGIGLFLICLHCSNEVPLCRSLGLAPAFLRTFLWMCCSEY